MLQILKTTNIVKVHSKSNMSRNSLVDERNDGTNVDGWNKVDKGKYILGDYYCKMIDGTKLWFAGISPNNEPKPSQLSISNKNTKTHAARDFKIPKLARHQSYLGLSKRKIFDRTVFISMAVNRLCDIDTANQSVTYLHIIYCFLFVCFACTRPT